MLIVLLCGAISMAALGLWIGLSWGWVGGLLGAQLGATLGILLAASFKLRR
ncbi:hypothetical protein ACFZ8E_27365 [Methylobacterium sp. HMF5984]|uniref:hypothetical protein n=1 Tax=Methylobacterium sp. HMF5984 TaxID=3367370 RepID=UPI0038538A9E